MIDRLSGYEYIENELKILGPFKNKVYSILGKGPLIEDIFSEIQKRRSSVSNVLNIK